MAAVPQELGVDDRLLVLGQRDLDFALAIELGRTDDERARGVVGELEPDAHDPALVLGVALVVVVQMQSPAALAHGVGGHAQQLDAPEAGADRLDPFDDRRALLGVRGPHAVEVGLAVLPEALELDLAGGRCDRREVRGRVARVRRVGQVLPLRRRDLRALVLVEPHPAAGLLQHRHPVVGCLFLLQRRLADSGHSQDLLGVFVLQRFCQCGQRSSGRGRFSWTAQDTHYSYGNRLCRKKRKLN